MQLINNITIQKNTLLFEVTLEHCANMTVSETKYSYGEIYSITWNNSYCMLAMCPIIRYLNLLLVSKYYVLKYCDVYLYLNIMMF